MRFELKLYRLPREKTRDTAPRINVRKMDVASFWGLTLPLAGTKPIRNNQRFKKTVAA
jgi:hypothetical protein